jgi:hypothetical protein
MEDLYPAAHHDNHGESNEHFCNYNIISDNQAGRDFDSATFLLNYSTDWHPVFTGKFFRGNVSVGYYCPDGPHAQATANYFHFLREQWYHILFSWDKENSEFRIYANGVLVGIEDLRGGQKLLFDLIDTPDLVREAMNQIRKLYRKIYDEFYVYGNKENLGTTCGLPLYSSGKYNRIQSDFICLLGPDMFREFVLPAIVEEAQFLDHNCFHLDGADALKHIDDILAIEEIDSIQWVPGAGKKTQFQWPEVLHKIQNAGKSIHIFDSSIEEIKIYHKEYKPELIVYEVKASSRVEGLEFLDWLKKNT